MAQAGFSRIRQSFDDNRTAWSIVLVSLVGGGIFVCLFAILILSPQGEDGDGTAVPFNAQQPVPDFDSVVTGGDVTNPISITLDIPAVLSVAEQSFQLQAQQIAPDGQWSPISLQSNMGIWVYGSVVNYIVGLPDSEANRELLDRLTADDQFELSMRSGSSLRFVFRSRDVVPQTTRDIFSQTVPGITIVLMGTENDQRLVVRGRYVVSTGAPQVGSGGPIELGQAAELNGLQILVTGAGLQANRPEAPAGFDFYLVDYQLQNTGTTTIDTSQLRLSLVDGYGTQYALSPAASLIGNFAPLSGFLNPGQSLSATAGYQLPSGLLDAELRWMVTDAAGAQASFNVPFGSGGSTADFNIALSQATVSPDGTSLLLQGQITNQGAERLVVGEGDVTLIEDGSGILYLLVSTSPGFPWVIEPGQTIPFSVMFQRPAGSSATFAVFNHEFQLVGLR